MFVLVLILTGVAIVGGGVLLLAGLRPARRGTTRFCRRCAYNLTGLEGDAAVGRCPECGAALGDRGAVVIGERVRRPGLWGTGVVLSAVGLANAAAIGVAAARQFDWYTLTPTSWAIEHLRGADRQRAARALQELRGRRTAGALDESQIRNLVSAALDLQARAQRVAFVDDLLGWLTTEYYAKTLDSAQRERFLRQMLLGKLKIRSKVIAGADIPAILRIEWRGPSAVALQLVRSFDATCTWESIECDGERIDGGQGYPIQVGGSTRAFASAATNRLRSLSRDPGVHHVTVRLRCELFEAPAFGRTAPAAESVMTWEQSLEASYEILSERDSIAIERKKSAALDQQVAANIWLDVLPSSTPALGPTVSLVVNREIPVGVGFDLWINERAVRLLGSPLVGRPGEETWNRIPLEQMRRQLAGSSTKLTIRLAASESAVKATTDLFELWDGELIFDDVDLTATTRQKLYPKVLR